jgi:hypothetical protein
MGLKCLGGFPIPTQREKFLGAVLLASVLGGCSGGAASSASDLPGISSTAESRHGPHKGSAPAATASPSSGSQAPTGGAAVSSSGPLANHILTYQMTLSSSNTSFGNSFSNAAPYLNYVIASPGDSAAIRAAGIKTGYYFDLHSICTSNITGACLIGEISIPESAFEHTCDGSNARIINTHSGGVTQYVSDVTSAGLLQALANVYAYDAQLGSWDFGFDDDAEDMSESYPYLSYINEATGQSQSPAPYCNFNESAYQAGMLSYLNSSSIPLIGNTLMPSSSSAPSAGIHLFGSPSLIGGMLENIYGNSGSDSSHAKESGAIWQSEENSELAAANAKRLFVGYEHVGGTDSTGIDQRNYVYASLLLSFSPSSTVLAEDGTVTNSGIEVNPEAMLVPGNPLVGEPSNISSLRKSGGAYVREYANCSYSGQPIGQCAAVVNSNASGNVAMPSLSQKYAHTAVISGAGVVSGIDDGTVDLQGPNAPSSINAEEAYILTK